MAVLIFVLVLSFLVVIHELGHLLAARWAGMKVDEFGIGYPPRIKTLFTWKETSFSLNWIPFGGFVQIQGENGELDQTQAPAGSFAAAPWPKQLVVILAGVIVNFLFGAVLFAGIFSLTGIPDTSGGIQITDVSPDSPADQAGLDKDQYIIGLRSPHGSETDITRVFSTADLLGFVVLYGGQEITVITAEQPCSLEKALADCQPNQAQQVYLRTAQETPDNQGAMGIAFESHTEYIFYPWYQMPFKGMAHGFSQALDLSKEVVIIFRTALGQLANSGSTAVDVAGPIGIAHQVQEQEVFAGGWLAITSFTAVISINLAIMNLLPIPALDGGRAVFILLRSVTDAKIVKKLEYYSNYVGYALLLGLIILITVKDIWRIVA